MTDDEGETDFDQVSVTVLPEAGILAVAEAAPSTGSAPLEVTFTGSNSMGDIASYLWDFKDGNTSTEADPANTFIAEGTYDVALTVTDAGGMTHVATISIVVTEIDGGGPDGPDGPDGPRWRGHGRVHGTKSTERRYRYYTGGQPTGKLYDARSERTRYAGPFTQQL